MSRRAKRADRGRRRRLEELRRPTWAGGELGSTLTGAVALALVAVPSLVRFDDRSHLLYGAVAGLYLGVMLNVPYLVSTLRRWRHLERSAGQAQAVSADALAIAAARNGQRPPSRRERTVGAALLALGFAPMAYPPLGGWLVFLSVWLLCFVAGHLALLRRLRRFERRTGCLAFFDGTDFRSQWPVLVRTVEADGHADAHAQLARVAAPAPHEPATSDYLA